MKRYKYFSLLVIALLGSCSGISTPSPTITSTPTTGNTPKPTFTSEPTYTPEPKGTLSHYGLIAYTSDIDGSEDIFTMYADGSNQTNITNNLARDMDPAWSPDGKKIAFISLRDGNAHIFLITSDGSDTTQLTNGSGSEYYFSWSPDGQKIAYVTSNNFNGQLIIMNPDGSQKTILIDKLFSEYEVFGWSPDSQYLVYRIIEGEEKPGLYIVNADGSNQLEWADLSYIDHIHWVDNKNFIAYSRFWWDKGKGQSLIQKLGTDGSRTEFSLFETTIVTVFDKTYVTKSRDELNWFTFIGTSLTSTPLNEKCEVGSWDPYFFISPNNKLAFATAFCSNTAIFFLVSDDGKIVQPVGDSSYYYGQPPHSSWSPDSKYVTKVIGDLINYTSKEDIYLFDIQKILKDRSTPPIRLTTDGARKGLNAVWQPIP